ncbi:38800_t:CDS:2 [Gigaspora margarita]|uniref:38800_t:CDS:1 n=1 Tax=Gigaspora margarita TaxID=4874 RepID=A0ABM8W0P3_GIGMA|nr:38800_t:CDS:2 [Gigaspora margarita]
MSPKRTPSIGSALFREKIFNWLNEQNFSMSTVAIVMVTASVQNEIRIKKVSHQIYTS